MVEMLSERGSDASHKKPADRVREKRKLFYRYVIVNSFGIGGVVAALASTLLVIVGLSDATIHHWSGIAAFSAALVSAVFGLRQWQHDKETIH